MAARWITTSTAFTLFRPSSGASVFTGFGRIHSVDLENGTMVATALALGVPVPAFDMADRTSTPNTPAHAEVNFKSLEDPLTRSRKGRWYGSVPNCDFCGKSFEGEEYMVDGPMARGGPWGNMCAVCYSESRLPLGIGKGQLYRWERKVWRLVGGYPEAPGES